MTSDHVEVAGVTIREPLDPSEAAGSSLEDEGFILINDLGAIVPLHPQSIRRLAKSGDFPTLVKIGGRSAVRRRDLREWLRQQA